MYTLKTSFDYKKNPNFALPRILGFFFFPYDSLFFSLTKCTYTDILHNATTTSQTDSSMKHIEEIGSKCDFSLKCTNLNPKTSL